jgi:nucleolar MIF4G domain-containing protein 1
MGRHIKQKRKQTEGKVHKSRKEIRKEQRRLKKTKRNEFFQRRKSKSRKYATENTDHEEQTGNSVDVLVSKEQEKLNRRKCSERERNQKLQMDMKNQRIKQLQKANQQEDKVIKKLEKQLKLSKRKLKSVPKSFTADGLDCILLQRWLCIIFIWKPQSYPPLNCCHLHI